MTDLNSYPLLQLLRRGSKRFDAQLVAIVTLAGVSNALLLAIINGAAENVTNEEANVWFFALFVIVLALYVVSQRHILLTSTAEVEQILHGIRVDVSDEIRRSDLLALEHIGRSELYASVSRDTQTISQAASTLIVACQSLLLLCFSLIYLAWLSRMAFALTAVVTAIGLLMHFRRSAELNRLREQSVAKENQFFDALTHLLDGFKEVKMSDARSADLFARLRGISNDAAGLKIRTGIGFAEHFVFAQAAFYLLMAAIVFVLPRVSPVYSGMVLKATAAILFIIGPISGLVSSLPAFSNANVAALNIFRLEQALSRPGQREPVASADTVPDAFETIECRDVLFEYADDRGLSFSVGPVNLSLGRGHIVFIIGGNGSGKSTFLKLLAGLYRPQRGEIRLDQTVVTVQNVPWYRSHFSTIFSDYHLFDRLYGLTAVVPDRVNELLSLMKLEKKTEYVDGQFTNIELSSGQRKRLALVVTLLENRPILMFDEWAADQDPTFRQFFYEVILPDLKKQGKTIIAVTHDEKYFSVADRILKMDFGQFVQPAVGAATTGGSEQGAQA